jgi:hypothetical protein
MLLRKEIEAAHDRERESPPDKHFHIHLRTLEAPEKSIEDLGAGQMCRFS